jgi:hypothetical protein
MGFHVRVTLRMVKDSSLGEASGDFVDQLVPLDTYHVDRRCHDATNRGNPTSATCFNRPSPATLS